MQIFSELDRAGTQTRLAIFSELELELKFDWQIFSDLELELELDSFSDLELEVETLATLQAGYLVSQTPVFTSRRFSSFFICKVGWQHFDNTRLDTRKHLHFRVAADSKSASSLRSLPQLLLIFQFNMI